MTNNRLEDALDGGFTPPPMKYADYDEEVRELMAEAMASSLMSGEPFVGSTFHYQEEVTYEVEDAFANTDIEYYHEVLKMLLTANTAEKLLNARNKMIELTRIACTEFSESITMDK